MGDRRPTRGEPLETCDHPADDLAPVMYGVYDAFRCSWCGGLCLLGVRQ